MLTDSRTEKAIGSFDKKFREICEKVPPLFFGFGLSS